jgi:hypothetical protein
MKEALIERIDGLFHLSAEQKQQQPMRQYTETQRQAQFRCSVGAFQLALKHREAR